MSKEKKMMGCVQTSSGTHSRVTFDLGVTKSEWDKMTEVERSERLINSMWESGSAEVWEFEEEGGKHEDC